MQKNKTRPPTYTINKNQFKIDKGLKHETGNHKNTRGIQRQQNLRHAETISSQIQLLGQWKLERK